jgi:hypothetical protein
MFPVPVLSKTLDFFSSKSNAPPLPKNSISIIGGFALDFKTELILKIMYYYFF